MAQDDTRKASVVQILTGAIAPFDQKDTYALYLARDDGGAIAAFLDDGRVSTLQASVARNAANGQMAVRLTNSTDFPVGCQYQIMLTKLQPGPLTAADIPSRLNISSICSNPISSLYHSMISVYGPLLGLDGMGYQTQQQQSTLDPRLRQLLLQVQAGLGNVVKQGVSQAGVTDVSSAPLDGILRPLDELDFWAQAAATSTGSQAKPCQQVNACLDSLRQPLCILADASIAEGWEGAQELSRIVLDTMRQVWPIKLPPAGWVYSQKRMQHFLKVMGAALVMYAQAKLQGVDIWHTSFSLLKGHLIGASQLLSTWMSEVRGLTQDWSVGVDTGGHAWDGALFSDPYLSAFQERIEQMYSMRETHAEMSTLLNQDEATALGLPQAFVPFAQLHPLHVSEYTTAAWQSAQEEYDRRMAPVENHISQKLKELFASIFIPSLTAAITAQHHATAGAVAQPQQVLKQVRCYGQLMGRPRISAALQPEKEALAKQMDKYLDGIQEQYEHHRDLARTNQSVVGRESGCTVSGVASQIAWSMQCRMKVSKLIELLKLLLDMAPSAADGQSSSSTSSNLHSCVGVASELLKELEGFTKELFRTWQAAISEELSAMSGWRSSQLMVFDSQSSHVKTHFSERLVVLLRQVRQVQAMGFNIFKDIATEVEVANKFYRYGLVLRQCANFYNNLATDLIQSHKPMMLKDAIEFEKVLMNPRDAQNKEITWRNSAALDGYVRRLNEVAERLAESNRQLRNWHAVLAAKVSALMDTDLVRHKDRWSAGVKEMRDTFTRVEAQGYAADSQEVWRQHWDFQLYKALQYQYKQGLECINKNLPEVTIQLVYRQHRLQYDPPLEDLRMHHYKDFLNAFLGLPLKMKGVSSLSQKPGFFRSIVDADPAAIARVYDAAEQLFNKLGDELKKYQDWVALGSVDMDEYVEQNLQEVPDWELNLRMLTSAARDAERLPNEVAVDCYRINLAPLKSGIEEMMKRLREALGRGLRRKAFLEREQIESFISAGQVLLQLQANSVEEIGRAGAEAKALVDRLGEVGQLRKRIDEKNRLLRQLATSGAMLTIVDLTDVTEQWDGFTAALQQYDAHLEGQRGQLQQVLARQVEEFKGTVAGFASRWEALKPRGGPAGNPSVILAQLNDCSAQLQELKAEAERITKECELVGVELPHISALDDVSADIAVTYASWSKYGDFLKERDELAHKDWLSMRDQVWRVEDFLSKWEKACNVSSASGGDANGKEAGNAAIAVILLGEIEAYRRCLPYLKTSLRAAGWDDSHWSQLFSLLGFKPGSVTKDTITLAHFLDKADILAACADKIKALDAQAQGEAILRKALQELKLWGLQRQFSFVEPGTDKNDTTNTQRSVPLIKEWREVMTEVGDHQSLVASLKQSTYFHMFKDEVVSWESKLSFLQEGLLLLQGIQRKWLYLAPIFARGALPQQQGRFRHVDSEYRTIMSQLEASRKVVAFAELPGVKDHLPAMASQLDACQRALSEYLEDKRGAFPRFYFIGDDDLLEILGQAKNPAVLQTHLKKLYAGMHRVRFTGDQGAITSMVSVEGEVVDLTATVTVTDAIESWLNHLTAGMRATLQQLVLGVDKMTAPFQQASSQVLGLFHALRFTTRVEKAISSGGLPALSAELCSELSALTSTDYTGHTLLLLKKQSLVLDLMHWCDVVEGLAKEPPADVKDWAWSRQLRYYPGKDGAVAVHMAEGQFAYTWEYQGNAPKLVYTPLTDKCYLTLTQAMALGYGGNPYGPAGTGKTESVKALGQAMGRQVLVFNCDEEFDVRSMGRIFVGLVKSGAWGCFDEFNRLDEEVLSAVSQMIQSIQTALKEGAKQVQFMDKDIEVDANTSIFVTLNPAGKGYGGRSKLPDNLKQLFRPIAMSVPDNELIAEVLLTSEGFTTAKVLAQKIMSLFTLARQGLSAQQHYDWGLRALKTTLEVAGRQLRELRKSHDQAITPAQEAEMVLRAVCVTKFPTLTFADNSRFRGMLGDLFPGATISDATNPELEAAVKEAAAAMKLELTQQQLVQVLQLHLACEQRIGVILVGPSGAGKSTLWQVLEQGYDMLGRKPVVYRVNPKAMPRQQLLGSLNMDTREWTDGVITAAARKVVKEPLEQRSWVICDGDVDPEWIESLNSVLDDNRLLTMPNGERIQFASNVNLIFECHSLSFASPATVSRCGMIFLSDEGIEPGLVLKGWLARHPTADTNGQLAVWFHDLYPRALQWALSHPAAVDTTRTGLLESTLSHMVQGVATKRDVAVAIARGLGSNMTVAVRREFAAEVTKYSSEGGLLDVLPTMDPLACLDDLAMQQPGLRPSAYEEQHLVMTDDVRQNLTLLAPWLMNKEPFLLVGPEGSGKSTLLEYCFSRLPAVQVAMVNCSAQTCAANVIQKLVQVCGKPVTVNNGRCLRPDVGRVILYLKNVNLPRPDKFGTIQLIAFLQQLLSHGGYYDDNLEFINIDRIQIVGSMVPGTAVGRSAMNTRFTAHTRIAYMTYPSKEQLAGVFSSMLQKVCTSVNNTQAVNLGSIMLDVYYQVLDKFTMHDHYHYQFTPRDVTTWVEGLQRYNLQECDVGEAVAHEAQRVFRDRLVDDKATAAFDKILLTALNSRLGWTGSSGSHMFSTLGVSAEDRLSSSSPIGLPLVRWSSQDFTELVSQSLKAFDREKKEMQLILVPQCLERLAAIDRVLSVPGGALLLCGPCGSGRHSLLQLMAYMHHMEFWTPKMSRGYAIIKFRNDLKDVMRLAGIEGKRALLYLEDHQLADPGALEAVISLLAGGEVPGLFTPEDMSKELATLDRKRNADVAYQGPPSLYSYFLHCLRVNLRVVISLNPSEENFRLRCEANPALLTCCTIQWWQGWNDESLTRIAEARLKDVVSALPSATLYAQMLHLHGTASSLGAAPRHFLAFADLYGRILVNKKNQLNEQQQFLKSGLSKLSEAATTVDTLTQQAETQRALLHEKQTEADKALSHIQYSMESAADRRREVEVLRKQLTKDEAALQVKRGGVEAELADVQPLLDAARAAVGGIKTDNINEIRSLRMAPDAIRDVLEGVLLLMGQEDTSWNNMKQFLAKRSVKDDIVNFDAHRITASIRNKVEKLLAAKAQSFEKEVIYRASQAAGPMATWVKANIAFAKVLERVAPLEKQLEAVVNSLSESQARLTQCEEQLVTLDEQVVQLKANFQLRTREAEGLKIELAKAEGTLAAASDLLGKLGGERERWGSQLMALSAELDNLPIAALITSAFITYLPAQPEDVRSNLMEQWTKYFELPSFNVCRFISNESAMLTWKAEGLPGDELSMQNAVAILHATQSPFIIDPSSQAIQWFKAHMAASNTNIEVAALHDPRFANLLELAVRFGKTLVVSEVDRMDPILHPLLRRDLERQGPRMVVHVGDKQVDYNDTFRLLLVTRNTSPYLPPDVAPLLAVTNFSITRSGLEGRLLGMILQHEEPELEAQKSALLQQEQELVLQLATLEKQLLQALATSKGNILDNAELIASLTDAKIKSSIVATTLEQGRTLQANVDQQRGAYRPLASRAATLHFLLKDLRTLDVMYQYSLRSFFKLFTGCFTEQQGVAGRGAKDQEDVTARITWLGQKLVESVYTWVSRSMYNRDCLTFALHLARHLHPSLFPSHLWDLFIGRSAQPSGAGFSSTPGGLNPSKPSWVRDESAAAYHDLAAAVPDLVESCGLHDAGVWAPWVSSSQVASLPAQVARKLDAFQGLLLVKAFRPDRLYWFMSQVACQVLHVKSIAPPPVSLSQLIGTESSCDEPVLFITTPGADPSVELAEYAAAQVGRSRYHEVAMGQGQGELALALIKQCAKNGDWLCLKNLHLVISWVPVLEKEVHGLTDRTPGFRLLYTSEPHLKFPASLLEGALKVTYEPPPGIKNNIQRTYDSWTPDFLQSGGVLRAQLLFVLAWFHAVVQERRNYIPQGWSKFYEFSFADLRTGCDVLARAVAATAANASHNTDWPCLVGLLESAIYGGRVDNPYDNQVLKAYIHQMFCPEVLGLGSGPATALPGLNPGLPSSQDKNVWKAFINGLPDVDAPSLFGLPANINKAAQQANSSKVLGALKQISLAQSATSTFDRKQWSDQLSPLLVLWEALMSSAPPELTRAVKHAATAQTAAAGDAGKGQPDGPVESFAALERTYSITLIRLIDATIAAISRVLKGLDVLTVAVQSTGSKLLHDQIPAAWDAHWEGPECPLEYCKAAMAKATAVESWYARANIAEGLLSSQAPLYLGQLFRPGAFLNAIRQQAARQSGMSLDQLQLATTWDARRLPADAPLHVQLGGLAIEGAQFDGIRISPSSEDASIAQSVPPMHLAWIPKTAALPHSVYMPTPVYLSHDRTSILAEVQLPVASKQEIQTWTLASVALVLMPAADM